MLTSEDPRVEELAERAAANIKILRTIHGWTQQDLADAVGCDRVTVARIETLQISPKFVMMVQMADAFGVDVSVFTRHLGKRNGHKAG